MSGRRSSSDEQWQSVKKQVKQRDHNLCRWLQILTPSEMADLDKICQNRSMLVPSDCAHYIAVSKDVNKVYDVNNIYFLCRWAHKHLDDLINPLTNEPMEVNEQDYWWWRIIFVKTDKYDESVNYKDLIEAAKKVKKSPKKMENFNDFVKKWW